MGQNVLIPPAQNVLIPLDPNVLILFVNIYIESIRTVWHRKLYLKRLDIVQNLCNFVNFSCPIFRNWNVLITPGQSLSVPLEIWSRTSLGFMTGLAILIVTDSPKVLVISIKVDIKPQLDHSLTVIILLCKTGVSQMTKCKTWRRWGGEGGSNR